MKGSGVFLELAQLAPRRVTPGTWDSVFKSNGVFVDKLCSEDVLLDAREFAVFENGEGQGLCSYLDNTTLDGDLQFMRLSVECGYSWKAIENLCKVAYQSEILYNWMSEELWLRTVSEPDPLRKKQLVFHSNVVPRGEYLRAAPTKGICAKQGCTEGFFRIGEGDPRSRQCGGKCDFAEWLKQTGDYSLSAAEEEGARSANELLPSLEERPDFVKDLSGGGDGTVSVISYRRGLFARKEFPREGGQASPNFEKEREVAKEVRHPNIVLYLSSTEDCVYDQAHYSCLTMELLQDDLDGVLHDLARIEDGISFRDSILVLLQIAKAMKHLHDSNFVHGDLKPGNIFVSRLAMSHSGVDNRFHLIKVGDFGRTQRVDTAEALQAFDFKIGTTHHTAPEVFKFRKRRPQPVPEPFDLKKMDVYSFGVVAYQVLTGLPSTDLGKGMKTKRVWFRNLRQDSTPTKFSRDAVMKPDGDPAQWRPRCVFDGALEGDRPLLLPLVEECWSSSPQNRPDFSSICERIQTLFDERFPSKLRIQKQPSYLLDQVTKLKEFIRSTFSIFESKIGSEAAYSSLDVAGQAMPMDH